MAVFTQNTPPTFGKFREKSGGQLHRGQQEDGLVLSVAKSFTGFVELAGDGFLSPAVCSLFEAQEGHELCTQVQEELVQRMTRLLAVGPQQAYMSKSKAEPIKNLVKTTNPPKIPKNPKKTSVQDKKKRTSSILGDSKQFQENQCCLTINRSQKGKAGAARSRLQVSEFPSDDPNLLTASCTERLNISFDCPWEVLSDLSSTQHSSFPETDDDNNAGLISIDVSNAESCCDDYLAATNIETLTSSEDYPPASEILEIISALDGLTFQPSESEELLRESEVVEIPYGCLPFQNTLATDPGVSTLSRDFNPVSHSMIPVLNNEEGLLFFQSETPPDGMYYYDSQYDTSYCSSLSIQGHSSSTTVFEEEDYPPASEILDVFKALNEQEASSLLEDLSPPNSVPSSHFPDFQNSFYDVVPTSFLHF